MRSQKLVEHNLAKVGVASSSLVFRSNSQTMRAETKTKVEKTVKLTPKKRRKLTP